MDDLDLALLEAWNRLTPRLRAARLEDGNPEAARRARRRSSATLTRPLRAWCLCLRAADSRLDSLAAVAPYSALRINAPHTLYLDAPAIRQLVAPVHIPWPGIPLRRAAARLGRDPAAIRSWISRGLFQVRYDAPSMYGHRGRPVPVVWSPSPLDPNANLAAPPDPVWGSMWQHHHTRVPDHLTLIVNREMTYRYDPRRRPKDLGLPRGWQFICPGPPPPRPAGEVPESSRAEGVSGPLSRAPRERVGERATTPTPSTDPALPSRPHPIRFINGLPLWPEHPEDHPPITCGRPARRLYCPLPIIDIPHLLSDDPLSLSRAPRERVAESSRPGEGASPCLADSLSRCLAPPPFFACRHCHQLTYTTLQADGWNAFIAHISRGLLYGHEVERPASTAFKRKLAYTPRTRRAPQRDRVLALLLQGLTKPQIAAALGRSKHTIDVHVHKLYRAHNVHSRAELFRELGVPAPRRAPSASSGSPPVLSWERVPESSRAEEVCPLSRAPRGRVAESSRPGEGASRAPRERVAESSRPGEGASRAPRERVAESSTPGEGASRARRERVPSSPTA